MAPRNEARMPIVWRELLVDVCCLHLLCCKDIIEMVYYRCELSTTANKLPRPEGGSRRSGSDSFRHQPKSRMSFSRHRPGSIMRKRKRFGRGMAESCIRPIATPGTCSRRADTAHPSVPRRPTRATLVAAGLPANACRSGASVGAFSWGHPRRGLGVPGVEAQI
jgi:hypothetical protein